MLTTRFAPSPTGLLHLGHVLAAGTAWHRARDSGGRFLLRLEDIDATRCKPEYAAAILEDLRWLGLDWDGEARVQSRCMAGYAEVLERLAAARLTYRCVCSRADIAQAAAAPHGPHGPVYPGTCRHVAPAETTRPYVVRLDMAAALARTGPLSYVEEGLGRVACAPMRFGDVVLARRDVPASYHLCATRDDADQGVTLVTRGIDLAPVTDVHRVLQALLGWPAPAYAHHRLLTGPQGVRLAKRDRAQTVRAMREGGLTPAQVRRAAGLLE